MKFKTWVTILLIIMSTLFILMLFEESIMWNIIGLIGLLINTVLLTKYSKICD